MTIIHKTLNSYGGYTQCGKILPPTECNTNWTKTTCPDCLKFKAAKKHQVVPSKRVPRERAEIY